jgi:CRP-like cAMP-binding protein
MTHLLIRKLTHLAVLSAADARALEDAAGQARDVGAAMDLIQVGEQPRACTVLLDGWACRYKRLPDGKRQITGFVLPGDPCDLGGLMMGRMDHSVGTLTPARIASIPRDILLGIMDRHPSLARALWQETLAEGAIAREWVVNVGRRTAMERIAHLLCELGLRLQALGLADTSGFVLPITQAEIADATGQTSVHVNRTLQALRREGLIVWSGREVMISDWDRLKQAGSFAPDYLFLNRVISNTDGRATVG